jgi:hypothetical protein
MSSTRNAYDHRLRDLVYHTRDVELAVRLGVPRSTAKSWVQRGPNAVVIADVLDASVDELRARVLYLDQKSRALWAIIRLLLVLARVTGMRLNATRVPNGASKKRLLSAVERASRLVPRNTALRLVGLTPARYHAWRRAAPCHLDDRSSCPKSRPTQLADGELRIMRDMVRCQDFRHFSIRALALHAQRIGRVFAASGTWTRQIFCHGWLRPRFRLHPSRKLLAWELASKLDPATTCRMLEIAGRHLVGVMPSWLYLHSLDSASAVERLVAFYVEQHNTVMPHRAFDGRTPDEVYFGVAANFASELAERRRLASEQRVASNRSMTCTGCVPQDKPTGAVPREAA